MIVQRVEVNMGDYIEFLKSIEFFETLDANELRMLNQACHLESYGSGQVVIAEGDIKGKFYIIYSGSINIFKGYHGKNQSPLADLVQGDMFGELSFIDDQPRSATAVTRENTRLLSIEKNDFLKLLSESGAVSFSVMKWITATIRKFNMRFIGTMQQRNMELERTNSRLKTEIRIRKEKENQLNAYQNELEEKVASRTKELREANEKLQHEVMFRRRTETEKEKAILKLENALYKIKTLSGLFPVCIKCKKIRDDTGYWQELEHYLQRYTDAEFRQSICTECAMTYYPKFYE
jgi:CRP-like cAMP-binding protein